MEEGAGQSLRGDLFLRGKACWETPRRDSI